MFSTIEGRRRVSSSTVAASVALIALSDDERSTQAHIQHVSYVLVTPRNNDAPDATGDAYLWFVALLDCSHRKSARMA